MLSDEYLASILIMICVRILEDNLRRWPEGAKIASIIFLDFGFFSEKETYTCRISQSATSAHQWAAFADAPVMKRMWASFLFFKRRSKEDLPEFP